MHTYKSKGIDLTKQNKGLVSYIRLSANHDGPL